MFFYEISTGNLKFEYSESIKHYLITPYNNSRFAFGWQNFLDRPLEGYLNLRPLDGQTKQELQNKILPGLFKDVEAFETYRQNFKPRITDVIPAASKVINYDVIKSIKNLLSKLEQYPYNIQSEIPSEIISGCTRIFSE